MGETTYIKRKCFARIGRLVTVDSHQSFAVLEKTCLQADDDKLHTWSSMITDVVGDLGDICIIKRRIHFVKDKERRRLIAVNREQQSQRGHGLFPTREMFHIAETF